MTTAETETAKKIYEAINRNDIPGALELLDPQIVRIEPDDFPTPGTYRGHKEMGVHLAKGRSTWAEGGCYPERFFVSGDKVVVAFRVHVRLKNETKWIDARIADGFTFRNGLATEFHSFSTLGKALAWAGIQEPAS